MTTDLDTELSALRGRLTGELITPDQPEWESARSPWNRSIDQRPRAVAIPSDVDDLRAVLDAARATGSRVAAQPHGHGASGDLQDCILIRTERFDEMSIDVAGRIARVGAGVDWGTVLGALDGTGLIALAGSNPLVSVVGYTLAGGHSAFGRAFGLAASAVTAVEIVVPDGTLLRIDADSDADLFWALRGGCGLFGVVTALEFRLFPVTASDGLLYGGKLTYAAPDASAVLHAVAALAPEVPEEVGISAMLMNLPDAPFVPEPLRGATICSVDVVSMLGHEVTEALLAPLRSAAAPIADTTATFGVGALPTVAAEPTDPVAALDRGLLLSSFDGATVEAVLDAFTAASVEGLSLLQLRPLGGAIARDSDALGVSGVIEAPLLVGMSAITEVVHDPAGGDHAAIAAVTDRLSDHIAPGLVASFLSAGQDLSQAYGPASIARLRRVAARVDPDRLMSSNRPLPA
jgi:FAD/FMN-containing dehydrogenase